MRYEEWEASLPEEIHQDRLWTMRMYRIALFVGDIAMTDAIKIRAERWYELADQLHRATASVSANIAEGYSRPYYREQIRFYSYALGSAREARDWYFKARHILTIDVASHRISLITDVIRQLLSIISKIARRASPLPFLSNKR